MKRTTLHLSLIAALALGSAASAGSLADPVVEQDIVVEDATSSSSGALTVALLAYLILIPVLGD